MARKQKDFNSEMDSYLEQRRGPSTGGSGFRFFSVEMFVSKKPSSDRVPDVNAMGTTVVERPAKRSWLSFLFGSGRKRTSDDDIDIDDLPEPVREEVEHIEHDLEAIDSEVEELEEVRESLLTRFFNLLRFSKKKSDDDEDIDPDIVAHAMGDHARNEALMADTQVVLRSVHHWLGKLPPEQIDAFKRSPDFQRYKELLDKYGLIK